MFEGASQSQIPKPQSFNGAGAGSTPPESWWKRLWHKIWRPNASTRYKVILVAALIIIILLIIGAIILFMNISPKQEPVTPPATPPQPTTQVTPPAAAPPAEAAPAPAPVAAQKPAAKATPKSTSSSSSSSSSSSGGGTTTPPSCALPNYPNATCTGVPAGTSLQAVSGDVHLTIAGEVYEGKDVLGCVFVEAPNITIRNTKIKCGFAFAIHATSGNYTGGGLLIQDVEIDCNNTSITGIAGYGFTAQRVNAHGCENGFAVDNDVVVEDSYIHDLFNDGSAHTDGIQMGGGSNITYRHNTILNSDPAGTSAIIGDTGSFSDVLITQNLLGGGGYSLYCAISPGANYIVTDNHFSRQISPNGGGFGPWIHCDNATQTTGNVWDDDHTPVAF